MPTEKEKKESINIYSPSRLILTLNIYTFFDVWIYYCEYNAPEKFFVLRPHRPGREKRGHYQLVLS